MEIRCPICGKLHRIKIIEFAEDWDILDMPSGKFAEFRCSECGLVIKSTGCIWNDKPKFTEFDLVKEVERRIEQMRKTEQRKILLAGNLFLDILRRKYDSDNISIDKIYETLKSL